MSQDYHEEPFIIVISKNFRATVIKASGFRDSSVINY